jgi:nicotinate-nucleotide adenylyltransferase
VRSIGIFGGSFDPIHLGHLIAAQSVREALGLSRIVFVPAGSPPHKQGRTMAPPKLRHRMVRLATAGNPAFETSDLELGQSRPTYTIETLITLRKKHPRTRLSLMLGIDQALLLDTWKEPQRLFSLARVVIFARPGYDLRKLATKWRRQVTIVEIPQVDVSASAIRDRLRRGRSIRYLVPDAVAAFIRRHRLYLGADGRRTN